MKSKREEGKIEDEYEAKRLKMLHPSMASSPPQSAFSNALLPLATYNDDDDEDDDEQAYLDNRVQNQENRPEHQEGEEEEDDDDDDDEIGVAQGQRKRMIELRRDCPYLDTVNRQVSIHCFLLYFF